MNRLMAAIHAMQPLLQTSSPANSPSPFYFLMRSGHQFLMTMLKAYRLLSSSALAVVHGITGSAVAVADAPYAVTEC